MYLLLFGLIDGMKFINQLMVCCANNFSLPSWCGTIISVGDKRKAKRSNTAVF